MKTNITILLVLTIALLAGCTSTQEEKILFAPSSSNHSIIVYGIRVPVYVEGREMPIKIIRAGLYMPLEDGKRGYAEDIEIDDLDEFGKIIRTQKIAYGIVEEGNVIAAPPTRVETVNDKRIYKMKPGDTLWKLGKDLYGNRHVSKIIALHNNIPDPTKIQINQVIHVPVLAKLLEEEGLNKTSSKEVELILAARKLFMKQEKNLFTLRKNQQKLPKTTKQDLLSAAAKIDQAITGLATTKPGIKKIPKKMIGQLKNISLNLKNLAKGEKDDYGYDLDMVHQRLVYALLNGIKWARNDFE